MEILLGNIKGEKGSTPVKGEDYFTPEDVEAIVEAVLLRLEDGDKEAY